ncbi:MAG: fumarylacetoacetase [Saprospiraceae bacterium]|nr:fumarylacetoacetase [Saprospiraceae bacterium]
MKSWIKYSANTDFPIQNIPFGIGRPGGQSARVLSRVGDTVIDVLALYRQGHVKTDGLTEASLESDALNEFISLGKNVTSKVREELMHLLSEEDPSNIADKSSSFTYPANEVKMLLPIDIGDYTDFYSSREHATNVGTMFRDPDNALLPNWLHLPVGYHGRASSIVVSGTPIHRPKGQTRPDPEQPPVYGPCKLMDFELEVAFVVGRDNMLGEPVSTDEAEDHIFGLTLFNDWSARDIQKWEYVPLGPFLGKNFGSSMSPWIITLEALEPFRVPSPEQEPDVLDYLKDDGKKSYDIELFVDIETSGGNTQQICASNFKYMYWTMVQQLAHHTVNGCNMKVGDVCASGTISGKEPDSYGSMLELSWKGTRPIELSDGTTRKFLQDGDTVILRGYGQADGYRIGFGECRGKVLPAKK